MTNNQPRQPEGIPAGGQFAPVPHTEAALALATPAVRLAPGESENFNELADGDVIETLDITRQHVDDGAGYWVTAGKTINVKDLITPRDLGTNIAGRDAWFERNTALIEDFLANRYDAQVDHDDDWAEVRVECAALLPGHELTTQAAADAAWNGTRIVQLHNESDHGTFGSENLGRLLREHAAEAASVEDPYKARGAAMRMDDEAIDTVVKERHQRRPLPDSAAMAIARTLSGPTRPALRTLATRGYANADDLTTELNLTWLNTTFGPDADLRAAARIDMMRNWIRTGADNS